MKTRFLTLLLLQTLPGLVMSLPAMAAPLCIHNFNEHQAHKAELPAFIRTLPMVLVKDSAFVKAAVIVRKDAAGRLTMEGASSKDPLGSDGDPVYIKEACFVNEGSAVTKMTLKFENDVTVSTSGTRKAERDVPDDKVVTLTGDRISVGMFTLELSTEEKYKRIVNTLKSSARATRDASGMQ